MVPLLHPALQCSTAAVSLIAPAVDMRDRRIPNWLVVAGLTTGFGLNVLIGGGFAGLRDSAPGFGAALLVYIPLFLLRAMGGGDVKLMAAIGSMAGPDNWHTIFVFASLAGGIYAIFLIVLRGLADIIRHNIFHILGELSRLRLPFRSRPELDIGHRAALPVPHAVAIACGALVFLFSQRH